MVVIAGVRIVLIVLLRKDLALEGVDRLRGVGETAVALLEQLVLSI
jgi:hypothetical protein